MVSRRPGLNMPGLTGKTGEPSQPYHSQSATRAQRTSSSPIRPPIEPLSPILGPASATGGASRKTFTHTQAATQYVAQPPPKPISLEENPDAIALRAAISILQMQKRKAEGDLVAIQKVKDRAREDPEGFRDALVAKEILQKTDGLFNISPEDIEGSKDGDESDEAEHETESEDEEMTDAPESDKPALEQNEGQYVDSPMADSDQPGSPSKSNRGKKANKWPPLPARQNVIRMPAINWSQYAVVGESLDKLHEDQRNKPTDGVPQRIGPDGRVKAVEGGKQRSQPAVIAAPYDPSRDKIEKAEKMSTRKGGKR